MDVSFGVKLSPWLVLLNKVLLMHSHTCHLLLGRFTLYVGLSSCLAQQHSLQHFPASLGVESVLPHPSPVASRGSCSHLASQFLS